MRSSALHETSVTALDRLVPAPRLVEIDRVDLAAPPAAVWDYVRHGNLARSPVVRALFAIRTLGRGEASLRIDDLTSSPERPGFQVLVDEPVHELAVAAIGRVWELEIPFVHVATAGELAAFDRPGFAKVAWAIRVSPRGGGTHLELEVRVDTTDEESWPRFRRYFVLVGIGSRFIRRLLLSAMARDLGTPGTREEERALPGDELLADAAGEMTDWIDVAATPETIWPWLVQMGCRRAGFYSYDALDNGGVRSAREIHPELQALPVGAILPCDRDGKAHRLRPPNGQQLRHRRRHERRWLDGGGGSSARDRRRRQAGCGVCLRHRRWQISATFDTGASGGSGQAISLASLGVSQGGLFWFFDRTNPEILLKVLNGCAVNQQFWVFSSATTNVGFTLTVTDIRSGRSKVYSNQEGTAAPPILDTSAFACTAGDAGPARAAGAMAGLRQPPEESAALAAPAPMAVPAIVPAGCSTTATSVCIGGRFEIEADYHTAQGGGRAGSGQAVGLQSLGVAQGGLFWFFAAGNPEMLVKVLDACSLNQKFWIFYAAGTNVAFTLTVTDTQTSQVRTYHNLDGTAAPPVQDTDGLPCT